MDCAEMRSLAQQLREGSAADIWYDAHAHRDDDVAKIIDDTQGAMTSAADFLDRLAELIE